MKLCKDCQFYSAKDRESRDECLHERAASSGVREQAQYTCASMRAGICGRYAELWEAPIKTGETK